MCLCVCVMETQSEKEPMRKACGANCEGLVEVKIVTGGNWLERYGRGGVEGRTEE